MSRILNLLFFSFLATFSFAQFNTKTWDIRDFGAVGDSKTLNTVAIQAAIDTCSKAGGGTVLLKDGTYLSGTILLKNKVKLLIEKEAKLLGSPNPADYKDIDPFVDATGQRRGKCLIGALEVEDISIEGQGIIDGQGKQFLQQNLLKTMKQLELDTTKIKNYASNRPFLLRFVRSSRISLKNIHLRQSAAWACHFYQCQNILIDSLNIYNHAHRNNDGIDLDSSSDAVIKNCTIDAGDDALCFKTTSPMPTENIEVSFCKLKSDWGAIKFGTESMGDFRNIKITDCHLHDTRGGGIKVLSVDGANISDITLDRIKMDNVDMPIFIRLGERLRTYRAAPKQVVGSIDSLRIRNVHASSRSLENSRVQPPSGILITGTPNHKIGYLSLENISLQLAGGGKVEHRNKVVAEDEKRYPEFSLFEVLPASTLYARHIKSLNISNLNSSFFEEDERTETLYLDVEEIKIDK
ncbi:MAG: glycosyl hydrolase family 28 protein [Bacteroidota bacterium]